MHGFVRALYRYELAFFYTMCLATALLTWWGY